MAYGDPFAAKVVRGGAGAPKAFEEAAKVTVEERSRGRIGREGGDAWESERPDQTGVAQVCGGARRRATSDSDARSLAGVPIEHAAGALDGAEYDGGAAHEAGRNPWEAM